MIEEITDAIESILDTREKTKYNIALGFFDGYASVDADSTGKRFCNVKLHYKDGNNQDIFRPAVPILFPGSKAMPFDFKLASGDEMIVLFSDRTLDQWKNSGIPQKLKNTVKDSVNHAFAIPVISHRTVSADLNLLKILDRLLGVFLGDKGNLDLSGTASTGTISQTNPVNELTALRNAIQGALNI